MTADELQRIALGLGNQGWVRYWLNFNDSRENVKMGIQVMAFKSESAITPVEVGDMARLGFELREGGTWRDNFIYLIPRTNEDGTPFELF